MTIQQGTLGSRTNLPRPLALTSGRVVELRAMKRWDRYAVRTFVRTLPPDALLVMPTDITNEAAADTWIAAIESGQAFDVLACEGDQVVGFAGLLCGTAPWTKQLGDCSLLVHSDWPRLELTEHLCRELVGRALDQGLRKIVIQVRSDDEDTRALLAAVGFEPEALLADQVIDERGRTHDLLIMSYWLAEHAEPIPPRATVINGAAEGGLPDPFDLPPRELTPVPVFMAEPASVIPEPVGPVEAPAPVTPERPRRARRPYAVLAVAFVAAALVALGAVYLNNSPSPSRQRLVLGATAAPSLSSAPFHSTSFASTNEGSGGVFIPVGRPAVVVRVRVEPDVVGTWFWCIESSFGMPLADHHCGAPGFSEPGTFAQTVMRIDPRWPSDAQYFVQMYCEGACVWHVDVGPIP